MKWTVEYDADYGNSWWVLRYNEEQIGKIDDNFVAKWLCDLLNRMDAVPPGVKKP